MVNPHDDPIELRSSRYGVWCKRFSDERDRVIDAAATEALEKHIQRVEHVGSTAVPGLPAKDIVDLDVVVADDAVSAVSRALEAELGGTRLENTDSWHPLFRAHGGQRFNDHVFAVSSDKWKVSVATRDVLCSRSDLREEYEHLKRELAREHDDLTAYSRGKTGFIERLLHAGREDDMVFDFTIPIDPQAGQT